MAKELKYKPHDWQRDDAIKATWLNTHGDAIEELQEIVSKGDTAEDARKYQFNTAQRQHGGNAINRDVSYDETNMIHYRDHAKQTADLQVSDGDVDAMPDGYYGNVHHVLYGEGSYHTGDYTPLAPDNYITNGDATIYTKIDTDIYGSPQHSVQVVMPVGSTPTNILWDVKTNTSGVIYIPTATTTTDPRNEDYKIAVRHRPHVLPPLAQDVSYIPDAVGSEREIQGIRIAEDLRGNTVPINGINNHGGVKVLGYDEADPLRSAAVQASIEVYGIVGTYYDAVGSEQTVRMSVVGTDEHGRMTRETKEEQARLYSEYNADKPYYTSGDGILAQWPIIDAAGSHVSDLTLRGGHFEDWQLWLQAEGQITLPAGSGGDIQVDCASTTDYRTDYTMDYSSNELILGQFQRTEDFGGNSGRVWDTWTDWQSVGTIRVPVGTAYVHPATATDYKYDFAVGSDADGTILYVGKYERQECFSQNNGDIFDTWGQWDLTGTEAFRFPAVGTHYHSLCIVTLDAVGTPAPDDRSQWIGDVLKLVQKPIIASSAYVKGPNCVIYDITGYMLI